MTKRHTYSAQFSLEVADALTLPLLWQRLRLAACNQPSILFCHGQPVEAHLNLHRAGCIIYWAFGD